MKLSRSRVWTPIIVVLGLGASYAIGQAQSGTAKPAAGTPKPAAGTAKPAAGMAKPAAGTESKEAPDSCPCAHKGMHEGHEGMHEDGHEGMHGAMGMHEGMECPLEQAGPLANVKVEKTGDGAVLRLTAKSAADVQKLQKMAEMMAEHMGSGAAPGQHKDMGMGQHKDMGMSQHRDMGQPKDTAPQKAAPPPSTKPAK